MARYGFGRALSQTGVLTVAVLLALTFLVSACGSSNSTALGGTGSSSREGRISLTTSQLRPGQVVTVRGENLPRGPQSDPLVRGDILLVTTTGETRLASINIFNGSFSQTVSMPDDAAAGEHTLKLKLKGDQEGKEYTAKVTIGSR
jgi:hypothetical protein